MGNSNSNSNSKFTSEQLEALLDIHSANINGRCIRCIDAFGDISSVNSPCVITRNINLLKKTQELIDTEYKLIDEITNELTDLLKVM